jgi:hypothetical protein
MVSADEGTQIDRSDEQCQNADSPSTAILEFASNVTVVRCMQLLKHHVGIAGIDQGIQID